MISLAVTRPSYANRSIRSSGVTNSVVAARYDSVHLTNVLNTDELLARLDAKKIRNADMARALGLPDSRIPEIRTKRRALKLDEAAKLVQAFELERDLEPVPQSIMRLVVLWMATRLKAKPPEDQVAELAKALAAFSSFVTDPRVRQSIDAAEGFFRALDISRPETEEEAPPGTDPHHAH